VLAACAIVVVVVGASYAGAALASNSIAGYRAGLAMTREWVNKVDSYLSPGRPSLLTLTERYFVRPIVDGRRLPVVLSILAGAGLLAGLMRSRMSVLLAMAIFFPFVVFAWLMLDYNSIHRYSTAYAFLWAILAAHAIGVLALPLGRFAALAQVVLIALLAARCAWWTLPALRDVRASASPPVAVMEWALANVPPDRTIRVDGSLGPWAQYFLDRRGFLIMDRTKLQSQRTGDVFLTEGLLPGANATFHRPRERTWEHRAAPLFRDQRRRAVESLDVRRRLVSRGERRSAHVALDGDAQRGASSSDRRTRAADAHAWRRRGHHARRGSAFERCGAGRFRLGTALERHAWVVDARGDAPNRLVIVSSEAVNLARRASRTTRATSASSSLRTCGSRPMTRAQKNVVITLTILIALTRLVAVAHSLFDWDEALFTLGVREYNVMDHHPHPPGYPLFIAAAKIVHLAGIPEFRAIQVVVVLGAFCSLSRALLSSLVRSASTSGRPSAARSSSRSCRTSGSTEARASATFPRPRQGSPRARCCCADGAMCAPISSARSFSGSRQDFVPRTCCSVSCRP
jgi:hypothetical protein